MITNTGRFEIYAACSYGAGKDGKFKLYGIHETITGAKCKLEEIGFIRIDDADPFIGYELDGEDGIECGVIETWYLER